MNKQKLIEKLTELVQENKTLREEVEELKKAAKKKPTKKAEVSKDD